MAAVIDFRTGLGVSEADHAPSAPRGGSPALRVIDGGRSATARRMRTVYLQRRVVAVAAVVVVLLGGVQLLGMAAGSFSSPAAASAPLTSSVYEVEPGDTLWAIATRIAPDSDPRSVVREVIELNPEAGISEGVVRAGQTLRLPEG